MTVITLHTVKHQTNTVLFSTFSFPICHCLVDDLRSKWVKWFHGHVILLQSCHWPLGYLHEKENPPHAYLASQYFSIRPKANATYLKICVRLFCHKFRRQGLTMHCSRKQRGKPSGLNSRLKSVWLSYYFLHLYSMYKPMFCIITKKLKSQINRKKCVRISMCNNLK